MNPSSHCLAGHSSCQQANEHQQTIQPIQRQEEPLERQQSINCKHPSRTVTSINYQTRASYTIGTSDSEHSQNLFNLDDDEMLVELTQLQPTNEYESLWTDR